MEETLGSLAFPDAKERSVWAEGAAAARGEWARSASSWKGRLALLGFVIATAVPGVFRALHREAGPARDLAVSAQARTLVKLYDLGVARNLYSCPASLVLSTVLAFYALPLVMLVLGYDAASRLERRSALPSPGAAQVVGAAAGRWAFFSCGVLFAYAVVSTLEIVAGGPSAPARLVLTWGASLSVCTCLVACAYVALWTFVSASFGSRRRAFGVGLVLAVGLGLLHAVLHLRAPTWARALPNGLDGLLLSNRAAFRVQGAAFTALWCAVGLAGAAWSFSRRTEQKRGKL